MSYKNLEAQKEYQRNWIALRRAEYFHNKKCVCCGKKYNLQLEHIDPKTKIAHNIWSWSEERRNAELAKCQIMCEECHKIKTAEERAVKLVHGTSYMYRTMECRCNLCKHENNKRRRLNKYKLNAKRRAEKLLTELPGPLKSNIKFYVN